MPGSSLKATTNAINKVLGKFAGVVKALENNDNGSWSLRQDTISFNTSNERDGVFAVYPFPINSSISKSINFFFSVSLILKANEDIESLNIRILKGDEYSVGDGNIIPTELLLRIEWSNETSSEALTEHAQPHWHIHPYKSNEVEPIFKPDIKKIFDELVASEAQNITSLISDVPNEGAHPNVNTPMYKFHLPMIAEWDKDSKVAINKKLDDKNLEKWLRECLNYTKNQLEFILKKMN